MASITSGIAARIGEAAGVASIAGCSLMREAVCGCGTTSAVGFVGGGGFLLLVLLFFDFVAVFVVLVLLALLILVLLILLVFLILAAVSVPVLASA